MEQEMNAVTADIALQQSLANVPGLTEIRDSQGVLLGYFSPAKHKLAQAYAEAAAHFDPAEIKRRKESEEPGRSTAEVLSRLKGLEK
jgi:hypothetical protein